MVIRYDELILLPAERQVQQDCILEHIGQRYGPETHTEYLIIVLRNLLTLSRQSHA